MTPTSIRLCDPHHPALNLRKWGDGARACVLIHGFGEGGFVWDEFALRLATDCAVLAMDLRGHADSEWDIEARYDLEAHTMDLQRLIGASTQDDIVLVGHSMGAAIALRLAARHERIAGIVLIDHSPIRTESAFQQIYTGFQAAHRIYRSVAEYIEWLSMERPLVDSGMLRHIAESSLRPAPTGGFELKRDPAMLKDFGRWDAGRSEAWTLLEKISCPALVVRGFASAFLSRRDAERMVSILSQGQLREISRAGHGVMLDNPEGFNDGVRPFIQAALAARA